MHVAVIDLTDISAFEHGDMGLISELFYVFLS